MELAIGPEEGISYLTDKGCNVSLLRGVPATVAHAPHGGSCPRDRCDVGSGWLQAEGRAKEWGSLGLWHLNTCGLSEGEASKGAVKAPGWWQEPHRCPSPGPRGGVPGGYAAQMPGLGGVEDTQGHL